MKQDPAFDPETEWLDLVRPTGLVVTKTILKELGATPVRQTALDSEALKAHLAKQGQLSDPWPFFRDILGWPETHVAGAGGPPLPDSLSVSLGEHDTLLAPTWAVRTPSDAGGFQLLVQVLPTGIDPDRRGALPGWEASAHQRFERLLRETQVFTGVLLGDDSLRLVHAPAGETSGWLAFPLSQLATVAGRPMLGGLKLLLNRASLFTNPENKRLPALLKASREAQAGVSRELAGQVLGALHELLRGLHAADPKAIEALARQRRAHLYEGLLTVLMRLVFLLYAEDRDLLPSHTDADSRALYEANYSVRGLLARLADDEAQNPDTMDERAGGWGRLLALFRLIHGGDRSGWIVARGGKLFDPDAFPFLEGRTAAADAPRVLPVSDGCVLRILRDLMILRAERLSYRGLDVEQIGSVYETVMGFTVETATGPALAIRAGKNNRTPVPVFVDCANLANLAPDARQRYIKESTERSKLPAKAAAALKAATDAAGIVAALGEVVDLRGSPSHAPAPAGAPLLQPTDERRRTGSHYTPRSLTEPIVRQALAPALERLGPDATPAQILDLKVCDPAMGSGAFLVEACRQLGQRLVQAWTRPGPKPAIPADEDEELHARRLVAQRCLYGVDRNAMATDLARLSLWLATLAREHEFTFLDHALKTGDSLVGLSRAQIAALNWDAGPGHAVMRALVRDRLNEALEGRNEIRAAPDDVTRTTQERRHREIEARIERLRQSADAVVSAFFSASKPKAREKRRAEIESWFAGGTDIWPKVVAAAAELQRGRHPIRPFHWDIEFPEAFEGENPGFDAMVGNPPFAGKSTSRESNRDGMLDWLKTLHTAAHGNADYVAHFFRRAWDLICNRGAFGLIATKTIGQGDTRETGLATILRAGATIFAAQRRLVWPGEAAVIVSVVHVAKKFDAQQPLLDGKPVRRISAYLVEGDLDDLPRRLAANSGKAFQGSVVLGMGFTFDDNQAGNGIGQPTSLDEMRRLIATSPNNAKRIFPYIGGEEVNNDPRQRAHRYVIDFGDLTEAEVRSSWPELLKIVEEKVRPARMTQGSIVNPSRWWQHARPGTKLSSSTASLARVLVINCGATPHMAFAFQQTGIVYAHTLVVFALSNCASFAVLQSRVHELWARSFSSSMKDDLRYAPTDCFETFALPAGFDSDPSLEAVGDTYFNYRAKVTVATNRGLTAIYNRFHDPNDKASDIVELRRLHDDMDRAVLCAYGWDDLAKRAKAEYLTAATEDDPKYQDRLFWPAALRGEVLSRLLGLNTERAEAEAAAGPPARGGRPRRTRRKGLSEASEPTLL